MGTRDKIIIDRLELVRLRTKQNLPHRAFKVRGPSGISKRTYNDIEKYGRGTERRLRAIARVMCLPHDIADFLPVQINGAKVCDRRRVLRLTREQVAARCRSSGLREDGDGIPAEALTAELIGKVESGEARLTDGSHDLCRRLAGALECRFDDLVGGVGSAKEVIAELLGDLGERWVKRLFQVQDKRTGGIKIGTGGGPTQPWSTAQVLVGALQAPDTTARYGKEVRRALGYLGRWRLPLGCPAADVPPEQGQGWALYEAEQTAVTDISCWVILAYAQAMRAGVSWRFGRQDHVSCLAAEVPALLRRQCRSSRRYPAGGFCPTAEVCDSNQRTYTTAMAVWALVEALGVVRDGLTPGVAKEALDGIGRGVEWLLKTWNREYGWVPRPLDGVLARHPGLGAQVLFVLTFLQQSSPRMALPLGYVPALDDFLAYSAQCFPRWEFEDPAGDRGLNMSDTRLEGTAYRLESSAFWWAPWSLALLGQLSRPGSRVGKRSQDRLPELLERTSTVTHRTLSNPQWGFATAQIGETLFGVSQLRGHGAMPTRHETR
jgi:hypothetical protein